MGKDSHIEWTHSTFSVWEGCEKVSPACKNCYAETRAIRFGHGGKSGVHLPLWGPDSVRKFRSERYWNQPRRWNREAEAAGERHRTFCMSLGDLFEILPDTNPNTPAMVEARERLWKLIEETPFLDWLLLTKRPENIDGLMPARWRAAGSWPFNVWLGATVESQEYAEKRLPVLLRQPAAIHFLSCEPLLENIDLGAWIHDIDWLIGGGESGADARPTKIEWARSLRDQAVAANKPYLWKQWGMWKPHIEMSDEDKAKFANAQTLFEGEELMVRVNNKKEACRLLDGEDWTQYPTPSLPRAA